MKLIHAPFGSEHPYEQSPIERYPRLPMAGGAVTLGVATTPAGSAETVTATWTVEGNRGEGRAKGTWVRDDSDASYWQIPLPAFSAGDRVNYRLYARDGEEKVSSEKFRFEVFDWFEMGEVLAYRLLPAALELICSSNAQGLNPCIRISFQAADRLQVRLEARDLSMKQDPDNRPLVESAIADKVHARAAYQVLDEGEERIVLTNRSPEERGEAIQVIVTRRPCRLEIWSKDGSPILVENEPAKWLVGAGGPAREVRQAFASPEDEAFFGFGERFNALDQRGNELDVRVFDQYKNQGKRTYIPVPFFLSSKGYGFYIETLRYVSYDLAASSTNQWSFQAELDSSGALEYELIVEDYPKAMITAFAGLTGLPALPPPWVFGPWMSGNEWNSQALVMEQVNRTRELGIPATMLVIEAWSDESTFYIWNDAQYTPKSPDQPFTYADFTFSPQGKWPDPKEMIQELHEKGLRVLLWQVPVSKTLDHTHPQHELDQAYMIEKGYCVHDEKGAPYRIRPFWFHDGLVLDFTNPAAVEWWLSKRAYLLDDLGIDGFKTDGGEHLWGQKLRFADGRRGDELGNLYPNLYVGAYHRRSKDKRGGDAITFSRSGFTGAQGYPCHWAGDESSTWEAFRASILAGINAGLSGIPFWGWDIAGFSGEIPSADLYLRATAMATFCPIMQFHSEYNEHRKPSRDRTPWNIQERTGDSDVIPSFRKFANLRMNLLPYIHSQAVKSSLTGLPLMRALPLEFWRDRNCINFPYQYLFGESLLVAPVVSENAQSQKVYLPAGEWYDFWTERRNEGPCVLDYPTPKDIIPVFVRAGTILPLNLSETYELGSWVGNRTDQHKNLTLKIYPRSGGGFAGEWFDLVKQQLNGVQWNAAGDRFIQIELSAISHEITLLLVESRCSSMSVEDKDILMAADFAAWRKATQNIWYCDPGKGITYVKLHPASSTRTIRLGVLNH